MGYILFDKAVTISGLMSGSALRNITVGVQFTSSLFSASCGFAAMGATAFEDGLNSGWDVNCSVFCTDSENPLNFDVQRYVLHSGGGGFDNSSNGSFSFSATLQLCLEDLDQIFPPYAPSVTPDPPFLAKRKYYWRLKPGSTISAAVTMGGPAFCSASVPMDGEYRTSGGDGVTIGCLNKTAAFLSDGGDPEPQQSGNASISFTSTLGQLANDTLTKNSVYGAGSVVATSGGASCSVSTYVQGSFLDGTASLSANVPRSYSVSVLLPNFRANGSDSYDLQWNKGTDTEVVQGVTGSWLGSYEQEQWSLQCSTRLAQNSPSTETKQRNTFGPVSVSLFSVPTVNGNSVDNTTVALLDKQMPGLTPDLPASSVLPPGQDTHFETGGLTRSWAGVSPRRVYLGAYRYLSLRVRSVGSANVSFSVSTDPGYSNPNYAKFWTSDLCGRTLRTGEDGEWVTRTIDLALDQLSSVPTDSQPTKWPLKRDPGPISPIEAETWINAETGDGNFKTGEGRFRGVLQVVSITVTHVTELDSLTLSRTNTPILTALWPWKQWFIQRPETYVTESGVTTSHTVWPSLWAEVDGIPSLEESGVFRDEIFEPQAGKRWVFYPTTMTQIAGFLNHVSRGGWQATINAPINSGNTGLNQRANYDYYCRDRLAWGLGGVSGWTHTGTEGWKCHIEERTNTLNWQQGLLSVEFPGNVGDVLGHADGAITGATTIVGCHVFGMNAYGILSTLQPKPRPTRGKVLLVQDKQIRGRGQGSNIGVYMTGTPYGRGGYPSDVIDDGSKFATISFNAVTRFRQWAAFRPLRVSSLLVPEPEVFFPFPTQFSDPDLLPIEEWRRIPRESAWNARLVGATSKAKNEDNSNGD